jgi:hypothetical protein
MRLRKHRRYFLIATIGLLVIAAIAGAALAASGGGGSVPTAAQYAAGTRASLATSPSSDQIAALSILGRAQDDTDAVPAQIASSLTHGSFTGLYGANVALARRAHGIPSGAAWVIPGTGAVCLIAASSTDANGAPVPGLPGGSGCEPNASATTGQMYVESGSVKAPGEDFVSGVVPNGVSSVTVDLIGGNSQIVDVHENVYLAEVHGHIANVRFDGSSGPVTLEGVSP